MRLTANTHTLSTSVALASTVSLGCAVGESTPLGNSILDTDAIFATTGGGDDDIPILTTATTGGSETGDDRGSESTRGDDPDSGDETSAPCPVGSDGCPCTMGGACDPGLACTDDACALAPAECGNGLVEDGEACDDGRGNGDANACKSDCTTQVCGDGAVGPGEACDDGNRDDTDACSNACALASCGDGITQIGEECDDANAVETDACLSTCLSAACGDDVLWIDHEECDDGNPLATDGCTNFCTNATCGDAIIWDGVETCDDGNTFASDGCTDSCQCAWNFEDPTHIAGWVMTGGWGLFTEAPESTNPAVPFTTQGTVFGTDGNRAPPYPGGELEDSTLTTNDFELPETLTFLSWHADEGGTTYDQKRIEVSTNSGASWTTVLDCDVGPADTSPFCTLVMGPRDESDWDEVEVDISGFAGQTGRVRFAYNTVDTCCTWEQGWYIDLANLLSCT